MIKHDTHTVFTGLAARVWAVAASSYDPAKVAEICREIEHYEQRGRIDALAEQFGIDAHELGNAVQALEMAARLGKRVKLVMDEDNE